jgi:hypothetical protein
VTIPCVASMVVKKSQDGVRQHSDAKMDGAVNVDEGISQQQHIPTTRFSSRI